MEEMTKQERQTIDFAAPKCKCGNVLSLARQKEDIVTCPSCDPVDEENTAEYFRLELNTRTTELQEARELIKKLESESCVYSERVMELEAEIVRQSMQYNSRIEELEAERDGLWEVLERASAVLVMGHTNREREAYEIISKTLKGGKEREMLIERWSCNVCGSPCIVEVHFENDKLPTRIAELSRFRKRTCICGESRLPEWKEATDEPKTA
jgi:hypothetical protein